MASANAGSNCQFDLTMAGVPVGAPVCATSPDCNDGNPCTTDTCSAGACSYAPTVGPACPPPAPAITTPAEASSTTDTTPEITGTCLAGASVTVTQGSATVCSATCTASGTFTCTPATAMSYGPQAVTATQIVSGTTSLPTPVRNFTIVRCTDSSSTGTDSGCAAAAPHCRTSGTGAPVCELCLDSATSGMDLGCSGGAPFCMMGSSGANVCVACTTAADCNDGNPCTTDACSAANTCTSTSVAMGMPGMCTGPLVCSGAPGNTCVLLPPTIETPSEGRVTTPTPAIVGVCVAGATVTVSEAGATLCSATCTAGGTYECMPTTPLAPGPHAITATQTTSSATSAPSPVRNFIVPSCTDSSRDGPDEGCSSTTPYCVGTGATAMCVACTMERHCDDANPCTTDSCSEAGACTSTSVDPGAPGMCSDERVCSGAPANACVPCVDSMTGAMTDGGCASEEPICVGTGTPAARCQPCQDTEAAGVDLGCSTATPECIAGLDGANVCVPSRPDAGGGADASVWDAGSADAGPRDGGTDVTLWGPAEPDRGGLSGGACGCSVVGSGSEARGWVMLGFLGLVILRRRRRTA